MGEVYRARDATLGRDVALKVISHASDVPPDAVARFLREAKAVARFNHPNIVSIYTAGRHDGMPFVALELVRGDTLADRLAGGTLPEEEVLSVARGIASALAEAHRHGVIHRDLKPANVMLGKDGRVRVLDFGLAMVVSLEGAPLSGSGVARNLAAEATSISGTPRYMAPEQWNRGELSGGTDVWALGVMLYEMLSGERPFPSMSVEALMKVVTDGPAAPSLAHVCDAAPAWVELVACCLERDQALRPTAKEVLARLDAMTEPPAPSPRTSAERLEASAPATVLAPAVAPPARTKWFALAAGGVVGVVAIAALWISAGDGGEAQPVFSTTSTASASATAATRQRDAAVAPVTPPAPQRSQPLTAAWAALGEGRHEDAERLARRVLADLQAIAGRPPPDAPPSPDGARAQRVLTRVALARARSDEGRAAEFLTEAKLACDRAQSWSPEAESRCCRADIAQYLAQAEQSDEARALLEDQDFAGSSCAVEAQALVARLGGTTPPTDPKPGEVAVTPNAAFDAAAANRAIEATRIRAERACAGTLGADTHVLVLDFAKNGVPDVTGSPNDNAFRCKKAALSAVRVPPFEGEHRSITVQVGRAELPSADGGLESVEPGN